MTVTPGKIAVALGRDPDDVSDVDESQWQLWINDALLLIEARLGDPDLLDQNKLDYVVREAVVAHIKHPDDATQVSISVDDASTSRSYRSGKGRVTILSEWWDLLAPEDRNAAFAVDTVNVGTTHLPWCDLAFGADSCSCGAWLAGFPIYEQPWAQ